MEIENEIRRDPLDRGLNLCWGGLGLCQNVVIAGFILTHDFTLLPDNQEPIRDVSCVHKHVVSSHRLLTQ